MSRRLRAIAAPFVVARPAGIRIRTRLRLSATDQAVLREVGEYLGHLAGVISRNAAGSVSMRARGSAENVR